MNNILSGLPELHITRMVSEKPLVLEAWVMGSACQRSLSPSVDSTLPALPDWTGNLDSFSRCLTARTNCRMESPPLPRFPLMGYVISFPRCHKVLNSRSVRCLRHVLPGWRPAP